MPADTYNHPPPIRAPVWMKEKEKARGKNQAERRQIEINRETEREWAKKTQTNKRHFDVF